MQRSICWEIANTLQKKTFKSQTRDQKKVWWPWKSLWWRRLRLRKFKNTNYWSSWKRKLQSPWRGWSLLAKPAPSIYSEWWSCTLPKKGKSLIFFKTPFRKYSFPMKKLSTIFHFGIKQLFIVQYLFFVSLSFLVNLDKTSPLTCCKQ